MPKQIVTISAGSTAYISRSYGLAADYVFLDENEAGFLTNSSGIDASAALKRAGVDNVIIKNGSKGSLINMNDKIFKITAFPPKEIKDPTGAGDSYMAGFITALQFFSDPREIGNFAAMTATICIESKGPFNKNLDEVLQRLKDSIL